MARSHKKPRKVAPSKKHGKEKKKLRLSIDEQRRREEIREAELDAERDRKDPWWLAQVAVAEEMGCEPEDLGECMRCGSPWPGGMKKCPECGWDGMDLGFMLPLPMPNVYS